MPERIPPSGFVPPMYSYPKPLFAFHEADHLTRIHLRLALEDLGFPVGEHDDDIVIGEAAEEAPSADA